MSLLTGRFEEVTLALSRLNHLIERARIEEFPVAVEVREPQKVQRGEDPLKVWVGRQSAGSASRMRAILHDYLEGPELTCRYAALQIVHLLEGKALPESTATRIGALPPSDLTWLVIEVARACPPQDVSEFLVERFR